MAWVVYSRTVRGYIAEVVMNVVLNAQSTADIITATYNESNHTKKPESLFLTYDSFMSGEN